ncbi:hypothetical protein B0T18DRAFT_326512 [Schizothecium vesticola]|uniref:NmrA-like domain-containing protein n=1 Tax=Schizothecium vesticola TaxID=314040 RepID=A0AA40EWP7_9PEZI|nr:hypothetical protein B0T18DRAFT_326512 [Schizothecium vesticola]
MATNTAPPKKKLLVVIGATGNQGGSVARRFLRDPRYAVRALTRNPASPAALALSALGADVVAADLDEPASLRAAFSDASAIFSVTQYWEPFFRPDCRAAAAALGVSCRRYAYDVEVRQGRNIADAAAGVAEGLEENGFWVSTLSSARECSGGRMTEVYHFDGKADVFPRYVDEWWPELARKMSCVHTGYFMTSWGILPASYLNKQAEGSYQMRFPTRPDRVVPHLDVNADMGNFVYAVSQMPPGKAYMCAGTFAGFEEYIQLWGEKNGVKTSYKQVTFDDMVADAGPGQEDLGIEVAHMCTYTDDPGYNGGMELLTAEDLKAVSLFLLLGAAWVRPE